MIILKTQEFNSVTTAAQDLALFVNKNNIKKEDIMSITEATVMNASRTYTIFYFSDSEIKEITKGFWG